MGAGKRLSYERVLNEVSRRLLLIFHVNLCISTFVYDRMHDIVYNRFHEVSIFFLSTSLQVYRNSHLKV